MSSIAIKVEDVSKQYRLGKVGTGTIAHDLNRWWHLLRGKEDPYLKIGEENNRALKGGSDYVWALRDINFDIEQGASVGIIGRNGAGKSTMLKILSRTTSPTTGSIRLRGRVASLLEVGTGFHPELSGRENVFLNGAILGMTRKEIERKFDEIVDFASVERYIDTPVKRYSSGMYVRLAFAVAAHLDSEILIVDEVLAVGDAEFQKKCLGKIGDVSKNQGRTVLFVSHNLAAIKSLCDDSILLKHGKLEFKGSSEEAVSRYLRNYSNSPSVELLQRTDREGNGKVLVSEVSCLDKNGWLSDYFLSGDSLTIKVKLKEIEKVDYSEINIVTSVCSVYGAEIATWVTDEMRCEFFTSDGIGYDLVIPKLSLRPGLYEINIGVAFGSTALKNYTDIITCAAKFEVISGNFYGVGKNLRAANRALIDATYRIYGI